MRVGIVQNIDVYDFIDKMKGKGYTTDMLRAIYDDMYQLSEELNEPIELSSYEITNQYNVADMVYAETEEEYDRLMEDDDYVLYKEGDNHFIDTRDLTKYYRIIYAEGDKVLWQER